MFLAFLSNNTCLCCKETSQVSLSQKLPPFSDFRVPQRSQQQHSLSLASPCNRTWMWHKRTPLWDAWVLYTERVRRSDTNHLNVALMIVLGPPTRPECLGEQLRYQLKFGFLDGYVLGVEDKMGQNGWEGRCLGQ